jgi:hypothetical protein
VGSTRSCQSRPAALASTATSPSQASSDWTTELPLWRRPLLGRCSAAATATAAARLLGCSAARLLGRSATAAARPLLGHAARTFARPRRCACPRFWAAEEPACSSAPAPPALHQSENCSKETANAGARPGVSRIWQLSRSGCGDLLQNLLAVLPLVGLQLLVLARRCAGHQPFRYYYTSICRKGELEPCARGRVLSLRRPAAPHHRKYTDDVRLVRQLLPRTTASSARGWRVTPVGCVTRTTVIRASKRRREIV